MQDFLRNFDSTFSAVYTYVSVFYRDNDMAHSMSHVKRVLSNIDTIVKNTQQIDKDDVAVCIAKLAALCHDMKQDKSSRGKDVVNSAKMFRNYFMTELPQEVVGRVYDCIIKAAYEHWNDVPAHEKFSNIEVALLHDADMLDSIGAHGIGRTFMYGGAHNIDFDGTVSHFYAKLLHVKDTLVFDVSKKLAESAQTRMEVFLSWLKLEH